MRWDLGLQGLGVLAIMSLAFGVIAQLIGGGDFHSLAVAHRRVGLLRGWSVDQRGLVRLGDREGPAAEHRRPVVRRGTPRPCPGDRGDLVIRHRNRRRPSHRSRLALLSRDRGGPGVPASPGLPAAVERLTRDEPRGWRLTAVNGPRVLVVGYSGANNTGAEALLRSDIEDLRAVLDRFPYHHPGPEPSEPAALRPGRADLEIVPLPPILLPNDPEARP